MPLPEHLLLLTKIQQKVSEGNNIKDLLVDLAIKAKQDNHYRQFLQILDDLDEFIRKNKSQSTN